MAATLGLRNILAIVAALLIWVAATSIYVLYISVCPKRNVSPIKPRDFALDYEPVTFKTPDHISLKGWFIPSPKSKALILVCHGYPFDKGNIFPSVLFLHKYYNLFLFDFRAMGESGGRISTVGYHEKKDLLAAIEYLKARGIEKIGALGFSLGAAVILMANSPDIKAIVADSSYANLDMMIEAIFRRFYFLRRPFVASTRLLAKLILRIDPSEVSPMEAIKELKAPVLLIHGEKDTQISVENAWLIHQQAPQHQLWVVSEADHGEAYFLEAERYEEKVLGFFDRTLR